MTKVENVARGLFQHWVKEDWANEYCDWDQLPDKETWRERARAALEAARYGEMRSAMRNLMAAADHAGGLGGCDPELEAACRRCSALLSTIGAA